MARCAEEALQHPDVAAVLVATYSDTHVDYIIQALQAGKSAMDKAVGAPTHRAEHKVETSQLLDECPSGAVRSQVRHTLQSVGKGAF